MLRALAICLALAPGVAGAQQILEARYTDPTTRYPHAVLGDAVEHAGMEWTLSDGTTRRVLWEDTEFSGVTVPANAIVYAILIAGNRDPEVFSDPDSFDITRTEARHCSFGGGIHFCLGSHLARMNAEIAFTQMASRFTAVRADESKTEWAPSLFRIPGRIPATFERRN